MTTDDLLELLKDKFDTEFTASTLRNYVNWELIPKPTRGGLGRGGGRTSEYQPSDVAEIVIAHRLLNDKKIRLSPDLLRQARKAVLEIEQDPNVNRPSDFRLEIACLLWASYRDEALNGKLRRFEFAEIDGKVFIQSAY